MDGGKWSTRKVFDKETVRPFRVSLGWVLSDIFRAGQLPASSTEGFMKGLHNGIMAIKMKTIFRRQARKRLTETNMQNAR